MSPFFYLFFIIFFELLDVVGEGSEVGRSVFVFGVSHNFLPLSEFFRVSDVGFCIGTGLTENFAVRGLIVSGNVLFFVIYISSFFAIASAEHDLFVLVEFSRDGIDD